jgi:hypothetical protein
MRLADGAQAKAKEATALAPRRGSATRSTIVEVPYIE